MYLQEEETQRALSVQAQRRGHGQKPGREASPGTALATPGSWASMLRAVVNECSVVQPPGLGCLWQPEQADPPSPEGIWSAEHLCAPVKSKSDSYPSPAPRSNNMCNVVVTRRMESNDRFRKKFTLTKDL